jgi:signal transduction histidine kinase
MNLSLKLTLIFSGIILLMGSISFYGIYRFQNEILEQEITEKLENSAADHLYELDQMFFERLKDLDRLSADPVFASRGPYTEKVRIKLAQFLQRYPQYASVSFFNMQRIRLASAGQSAHAGKQHSLSEYWPAIYAGQNHVVNISKSESLQVPTLHFADRVEDGNGKTIGVLVARIPVAELYGLMDERKGTPGDAVRNQVDILDSDGTVLYSNHNGEAVLNAVDEDFDLIKDALPSAQSVYSLTHTHERLHEAENHVLMVIAKEQGYRSFKGNGWILKIMHPREHAFAPVAALSWNVLLLLLSTSLLGIATILGVLSFTVVRPIRKLNNATAQLGKGALDTRVAISSSDEIGKLATSFNEMAVNLKEARVQLAHAAETALARANLAERKIINISEETQQRIGRELHDDLGQQLTGVAFMSEVLSQHLKSEGHPDAHSASKITTLINEAISKTRRLAHGLYPVEMKESGLRAMLMNLASTMESIYRIECELACEGKDRIDSPLAITNLFRIAQEAIHNSVKHSGASKVTLRLRSTQDATILEIADNGCGIGDAKSLEAKGGLGMHTMRYRASLLGATLSVAGSPAHGTRVTVTVPATRGANLGREEPANIF